MCITGICHDKYLTGLLRYGSIYTLGRNWLLTKPHRWNDFILWIKVNYYEAANISAYESRGGLGKAYSHIGSHGKIQGVTDVYVQEKRE